MRTGFGYSVSWLAACAAFCAANTAKAEPDMRNIPPFVMIVADTSGSMEWKAGCTCTTDCSTCYPDCSLPNDSSKNAPPEKKNRWAMLVEALTGSFTDFQCVQLTRNDSSQFTYDLGYSKPFHRPWICPGGQTYCDYPGTATTPIQSVNGLLDNYGSRIRFGLATFDGMRTYAGASDLVVNFNTTLSEGAEGMYSYGGVKRVRYPTCDQTHLIDSGLRSPNAPEGGLISLRAPLCATPPCDPQVVNDAIQESLLKTRTFGGTPTGSALDDLYYHFKEDLKDTVPMTCRHRFGILITDGYPDDDFREFPNPGCDCKNRPDGCGPDEDPELMECPYPTASQAAHNLVNGRTIKIDDVEIQEDRQLEKLYVVGMSISDATSRDTLNDIALKGNTEKAFFADDPATLTATLDEMLGAMINPISRSVPAFASTTTGTQFQVSAGFDISPATTPAGFTPPWTGILERRRFFCDGNTFSSPTLTDADRFHIQLNKTSSDNRNLFTALPSNLDVLTNYKGLLTKEEDTCGLTGCTETSLDAVPTALFGSIDAARRDVLIKWMYGAPGSLRENMKLGDIYHSSPAIVGQPVEDPGDQSYTLFRESTLIQERPSMLYVNSNDGILHAFVLEDHKLGTETRKAGTEEWGFVPPILLSSLDQQLAAHRLNLDGTPVVKDVYFSKSGTPAATDYKTVLISGMRGGGHAYFALDVTNPIKPKFLWQFRDDDMGETYGLPEIVQARYSLSPSQPASLRAMVILSGGKGELETTPGCIRSSMRLSTTRPYNTHPQPDLTEEPFNHRTDVRCWKNRGRALYFVDVETGQLIKKIGDGSTGITFPSPLIGSPTAYQDSVGTVASEGFVMDADGVLWRIDMTATDPKPSDPLAGWTARPFHDLFWDGLPADGETSYERPILSLDEKHQLVVIVGTGDTDNFEKANVLNRVVSLTELVKTTTPTSPTDYIAGLNWEIRPNPSDSDGAKGFVPSELVSGSMALFASQLFFASFISQADENNPCSNGLGRLWSVHFTNRDPKMINTVNATSSYAVKPTYGPLRIAVTAAGVDARDNPDTARFNVLKSQAEPNLLVLGLGSTQRATCEGLEDPKVGNYYSEKGMLESIKSSKPPVISIVAQVSSGDDSRKRAGSDLGTLDVKLDRPKEFSQVSAWAGSIE